MPSTLKDKSKTYPEMLPQSLALKVLLDAPGKEKPDTGSTDPAVVVQAGFRHGRGESPQVLSPSPAPEKSKRGVTRVEAEFLQTAKETLRIWKVARRNGMEKQAGGR
jgi:hypothetical protein